MLFALNRLADFGITAERPLGMLPRENVARSLQVYEDVTCRSRYLYKVSASVEGETDVCRMI